MISSRTRSGHVAPILAAAVKIGAADEIGDAHYRADSVIGEALQMIDQVLAREGRLRHGVVGYVLKSEMTVEIDQCGHHGFAREVDVSGAGGDLQLASGADTGEVIVLDDEDGVLDGRAAVAGDEARSFVDGHAGISHWSGAGRQEQAGDQNSLHGLITARR